jgi:hypothetical protein
MSSEEGKVVMTEMFIQQIDELLLIEVLLIPELIKMRGISNRQAANSKIT